jgi:hypothetical protein
VPAYSPLRRDALGLKSTLRSDGTAAPTSTGSSRTCPWPKLLSEYNEQRGIKAVEWEFPFIPVGYGAKIKFWHDFYSIQGGVPVLSFLDPRLTDGLGKFGRAFVFSATSQRRHR